MTTHGALGSDRPSTSLLADQRLALGAEAEVRMGTFLGRAVVEKRRLAKGYRHPVLDAALRADRTKDEANLLLAARRAGVAVPVVYDVDRTASTLRMEHVQGRTLRDVLADRGDAASPATKTGLLAELGRMVAGLHAAGLAHGDLTTSNVLVVERTGPGLVLIDFGLGEATAESEPRGVDLHLLEEALEATQPDAAALFAAFLQGYQGWKGGKGAAEALRRLEEIRSRGRNR